jgi:hypothetical protein
MQRMFFASVAIALATVSAALLHLLDNREVASRVTSARLQVSFRSAARGAARAPSAKLCVAA